MATKKRKKPSDSQQRAQGRPVQKMAGQKPVKQKKVKKHTRQQIRFFDYSMLAVIVFLMCFGLVMLYSISSYQAQTKFGDDMYFLKRQATFSMAGIIGMLWVARWDYHRYAKWSPYLFGFGMFLMALVEFTPLGKEVNEARRWIRLPANQQFQPSEVVKIAIILFIPYVICKMGKKIHTFKGSMAVLGIGLIAFFGVFKWTDNLSTGIIVFGIVYAIVTVVHKRSELFLAAAGGVIALGVAGSLVLGKVLENSTNFRLRRILAWLRPEDFAATSAYQTMQGMYAIGSGGFFGKGLGNGAQKMIIPEVQNDMILSAICEELGVFGAIIILVLFGLLLYRLLFIAQNAPDIYGSLIVTGIMAHIAIQVILNIAVVTNVIPNTGITLPFISYGGTSVVFLTAEMGIALGVSRKIKVEE